jgi:Gpi18-like mannosyltransferase
MVLGLVFALYLRYLFRYFSSDDFVLYTNTWYIAIQSLGFPATSTNLSNYTPTYLYILFLVSRLLPDFPPVVAIKILSVIFDVVCAIIVYLIVRLKDPTGRAPLFAFLLVLLAPTVVVNGAVWGQADSIYSSMLLGCVYCLMTRRTNLAAIAFGIAISLKAQAVYLAPALLGLWLRRREPLWGLLLIPAVYAAMMLPAWLAGRPAMELATVYLSQAETFRSLSMNAPNLYAWLPEKHYQVLAIVGLLFAVTIVLGYVWMIRRSKVELTQAAFMPFVAYSYAIRASENARPLLFPG